MLAHDRLGRVAAVLDALLWRDVIARRVLLVDAVAVAIAIVEALPPGVFWAPGSQASN